MMTDRIEKPARTDVQWVCFDCASTEGFTTVETHTPDMHEFDVICSRCKSPDTGDPSADGYGVIVAELQKLREENEQLRKKLDEAADIKEAAQGRWLEAKKENRQLREVLDTYANVSFYEADQTGYIEARDDQGQMAREALGKDNG